MPTLREISLGHSAKRDITDIPSLSVDLDIKDGVFESNGKQVKYNYVEIDGYKYTIKAKVLEAIKSVIAVRPQTKHVKIQLTPKGEYVAFPLD